jgi:hypothetical protein
LVLDFALVFAHPCLPGAYPIAPLVSAAMSQQKLTKLAVEQIPAQGEDVVVWDTALPGFGVRVKPTGVRHHPISRSNDWRLQANDHWSAWRIAHL